MRDFVSPAPMELRSESERILSMRIAPFGVMGRTANGLEVIAPGAFAHVDPTSVVLRQDHTDPPAGRGLTLEERADGAWMDFRVARTPRGDEVLANVAEGMHRNASIGFDPSTSDSVARAHRGQPVTMHRRLDLREVSTTWRPVYTEAGELAVRMEDFGMPTAETEPTPAPVPTPIPTPEPDPALGALRARIAELEERSRQAITLPSFAGGPAARAEAINRGAWAQLALRSLLGERVDLAELRAILPPSIAERAIEDVTTTGNLGVVPEQFRTEMIGEINRARPFLESTREVPSGSAGLTFNFPKITQRPLTGVQSAEKGDLASRPTTIGIVPFDAITIGGVGDLSLQLLRRSSPQFLTLWLDLLQESYAINCDDQAVDALLAESTVVEGGELDPVSPLFGGAFTNAMAVAPNLLPDRLWLSTAALAAFIDAKEPAGGGGRPLYPGLATISGVTDGPGGPIPIRLRPVHVPALDDEAVDVIIGPSRGFAWAEDGTYTLQADVPSKAGRDVGIVGMLWLMPIYPAAFTTYTLPVVVP